ncbi:TPA: hypothetical protein ACHJIY_004742 [Klebsiella pneumoniae]
MSFRPQPEPTPIKEGDPLQVASWYQICFDAGLPVTVQVNESRD